MPEKVTMKDIAKALGVTAATVHRALLNKEGVSAATRAEIQKKALELGYRSNYMASALKRRQIRLAIIIPRPTGDDRFYYGNIWLGVRRFLAENEEFNMLPIELSYEFSHNANGDLLKLSYDQYADNLDGILTMGIEQAQTSYYMEKFNDKNIPVVILGADVHQHLRFCCVRAKDMAAGTLAAELLFKFQSDHQPKKVIMIGHYGQLGMADQVSNAEGFEVFVKQFAPEVTIERIHGHDHESMRRELKRMLEIQDIYAVYSCSARYSVYAAQVLEELGLSGKIKLIGNDCFEESIELLNKGTLTAIIDKKVQEQSYLAMKTLFDFIVKREYPAGGLIEVWPEVILQGNADKTLCQNSKT